MVDSSPRVGGDGPDSDRFAGVQAWLLSLWDFLKKAFFPAVAVIFFAVFVYNRIWTAEPVKIPEAKDVAEEWSQSISRLGILPVFPPEEDFHVGDIWAVVFDERKANDSLLNRGFRIGHLDLHSAIVAAAKSAPLFAETAVVDDKEKYRKQSRIEVSNDAVDKITLSLAAFPGVTLSHINRDSATLGLSAAGSGASRDSEDFEETRVPVAETYGISAETALARFTDWCKVPANAPRCTEDYLRSLLSFGVDPKVTNKTNDRYDFGVQIQIVVRVFLTREIEQRRRVSAARGGTVKVSADGTAIAAAAAGAAPSPADANIAARNAAAATAVSQASDAAQPGKIGTGGAIVQADGVEVRLSQVFQRPVAFGYRAITLWPQTKPN